jgi:hypothetical protein
MLLKDAIKEAKKHERKYMTHRLIYKVYDPLDHYKLVYIGMGGKSNRPGSGRLIEHRGIDNFSSFKTKYIMSFLEKDPDIKFIDCLNNYDNLVWEIETYPRHYTDDQVKQIEQSLIRENLPKYNISQKPTINENYIKFFE